MEQEPRKASDVLLDLEKKMDIALSIIRSQDLSIKILSNKLNSILELLQVQATSPSKITVEAVNTIRPTQNSFQELERKTLISNEATLPLEENINGFRRTSRPETFAGDNSYLSSKKPVVVEPKFPVQIPKTPPNRSPQTPPPGREAEVITNKKSSAPKQQTDIVQNAIPVMQRVVNSQGKSLFLADVEITDLSTMNVVSKTRTNGAGKWMASLSVGDYRIVIRKLEPANKLKMEATQTIHIDGSVSRLDLEAIIIK